MSTERRRSLMAAHGSSERVWMFEGDFVPAANVKILQIPTPITGICNSITCWIYDVDFTDNRLGSAVAQLYAVKLTPKEFSGYVEKVSAFGTTKVLTGVVRNDSDGGDNYRYEGSGISINVEDGVLTLTLNSYKEFKKGRTYHYVITGAEL